MKRFYDVVQFNKHLTNKELELHNTFHVTYWKKRADLVKGHGPIDIYLIPLLALRYASMFPEKVQWDRSVMLHPRCEDVLYALWDLSDLFQSYHLKIKAKTSLQRYARQYNIFLSSRIVLKVSDHC